MPGLSAVEDYRALVQISTRTYRDTEDAVVSECILEKGNARNLGPRFDNTHEGFVFVYQHKALLGRLLMNLMRLHDRPSNQRECLAQAFELIRDSDVQRELIASQGVRLQAVYGSDPKDQISDVESLWSAFRQTHQDTLGTLRGYRSSILAHSLSISPSDLPTYGQLFDILHASEPIVEGLCRLTGVTTVSFSAVREVWNERADAYWGALLSGDAPGGLS